MTCCDPKNGLLPNQATAGLPFKAVVTLASYPSSSWDAKLYLRGPKNIDLTAAGDGTAYTFSASAADTTEWTAGMYWYSLRVEDGSDLVEIETGQLRVLPDITAAAAGYDGRSQNEIALEAIKAVLAKRATHDQQRYTINNRELWRTSIGDLLKLQAFYVEQVRRENACKSGANTFGRQIPVRFKQ